MSHITETFFYQKSVEQTTQDLQTDPKNGLHEQEVQKRFALHGPNELSAPKHYDSFIKIFFKQFQNSLIYILLIAVVLIIMSGYFVDALVVSGILLFNAFIGTIQEEKAQSILKSLQHYAQQTCVAIRNGKSIIIPVSQVVIGDLLQLQEGEQIPADARIIQSYNLKVDEALLTGESHAVEKITEPLLGTITITDQKNMVFKGTYIVSGSGTALVTSTGDDTQIGKLKTITEQESIRDFPLKKKLNALSNSIILYLFIVCIAMFIVGLAIGKPFKELIAVLAALFVCIIPEGLPIVFTLSLVGSAKRMAKNNVLIKKLQAVEGLGTTDVIIIDKTGTLTRNEMVVTDIFMNNNYLTVTGEGYFPEGNVFYNDKPFHSDTLIFLAQVCALLDQAIVQFDSNLKLFSVKGEPMEAALGIFAQKVLGSTAFENEYKKFYQLPFDYTTRTKAVFLYHNDKVISLVSGAPEVILAYCNLKEAPAHNATNHFFTQGLRLIAIAYKECSRQEFEKFNVNNPKLYSEWITHDLKFLAILGIQDAIRPEVAEIINETRSAGLHVVMATGDHKDTALAVAKKVNIFTHNDEYLEGSTFNQLNEEELLQKLPHITVFARVTPEQKLKLAKLFQKRGYNVAMTGDGVNDAPALVAADLGIAMGNIGTEVAKQAADIILLDDSFLNIIEAIKEGRHIFFILQRVTYYFFTTNFGELLLILFALVSSLPLPLLPAQILWLNLITDGFLDLSLSEEPREENLLKNPIKSQQLINMSLLLKILYLSLPMALISLGVFIYYQSNILLARTMALTTMAMLQWFNIWNCRSETKSIFHVGFFSNPWLLAACAFVFLLQLLVLYVPFMQHIFNTVPLTLSQWMLIIALSTTIIVIEEIKKWITAQYYSVS